MTTVTQFSNELDILYSRGNNAETGEYRSCFLGRAELAKAEWEDGDRCVVASWTLRYFQQAPADLGLDL